MITAEVYRLNTMHLASERDTYKKAFLQVGNLWTKNETVKELCFGQRVARMAAELLGVRGVRVYHDLADLSRGVTRREQSCRPDRK